MLHLNEDLDMNLSEGKSITQAGFKKYLESMLPVSGRIETTDDWWNRISAQDNILEFV